MVAGTRGSGVLIQAPGSRLQAPDAQAADRYAEVSRVLARVLVLNLVVAAAGAWAAASAATPSVTVPAMAVNPA